ncbi:isoprenylcysteine carboxylmethyltransferase family protein [bacterium]|nr:isoprenylcysteine carboxylmethyltransferase family protein [bacterium]
MAESGLQYWRTRLSKVLGALALIIIVLSESAWERDSSLVASLLFLAGCTLAAIGSLGRLWCSLYIAGYKTEQLITAGPYSITRNPLYFFSFLGALGVGLASETLVIPAVILVAFAVYYPAVIRAEEKRLNKIYGEKLAEYIRNTPKFFPQMSLLKEPEEYVVRPVKFRRHISSALWFIWLIGILEVIEGFHESGLFDPMFSIF